MTNGESKALSQKDRLPSATPFFCGLLISLVLGFAIGILFVNRYVVFETERGNGDQVVLMRTPLGALPPQRSKEEPSPLWAVIYPNSKWDEQNNFVFYGGLGAAGKKTAKLIVARFETSS